MFLIDGSTSIHDNDFNLMKTFITKVANGTVISKDGVHIGVVQYSDDPKDEFALDQYYDKNKIVEEIGNIKKIDGNTYTGKALEFISKYFDAPRGRPNVPQFLIVITDGEAHDAVAMPAKAIRDKGVSIFSIGVGEAVTEQLEEISGTREKVYMEKNFDALQYIEKNIQFKLCSPEKGESLNVTKILLYVTYIAHLCWKVSKSFVCCLFKAWQNLELISFISLVGMCIPHEVELEFELDWEEVEFADL